MYVYTKYIDNLATSPTWPTLPAWKPRPICYKDKCCSAALLVYIVETREGEELETKHKTRNTRHEPRNTNSIQALFVEINFIFKKLKSPRVNLGLIRVNFEIPPKQLDHNSKHETRSTNSIQALFVEINFIFKKLDLWPK